MTAIDKLADALDASRQRRFGPGWHKLDWYGRPLPEKAPETPSNYSGKVFLEGMARKIVRHSVL